MDSAPINPSGGTHQASLRKGLPEFSDLVLACRYHPFKTLAFGSFTSLLFSAVACCLVYPTYEAESLVRVKQHQAVVFAAQSSRADDLAFVHSQEQLALSQPVISAVLADAGLQQFYEYIPLRDPSEWLKEHVRVDMQTGSEVLTITAKHPAPQVSQAICNALTNAYVLEVTERQKSDQDRRQIELERAAQEAERQLAELWAKLNEVAIKVGSENTQTLTIRDEIQLQAYRDYAQQLRALQLRGHELASQLAEAQHVSQVPGGDVTADEIDHRIQNDPNVAIANQRLAALDEQLRQMREIVAHDDSPRLKRLQGDREFYATELERVTQEASRRIRQEFDQATHGKVAASLANLQKQIELNESEMEFLRHRLSEIDTGVDRNDKPNGLQLDVTRHEVDRQARLTDGLWHSLEELKIERQSQPRVQLMQLARIPDSASYDKQLKAIAAVVATCWIIIILGTGYFEWRSCTIRHTADVIESSRFPVFGDVERSIQTWLNRSASAKHTTGAQQAVAQILLSSKQLHDIPTLMVTSAIDSEPRHILATDLAKAFATLHYKTLLIDFDTAYSRLGRELKCGSAPGLQQIHSEKVTPRRFIVKTSTGIDFLPLGTKTTEAMGINPHAFADVMQKVRSEYQAIVVAGPPILDAAEGLINAAQVDQVVFTVCGGVSHWDELIQAEEAVLRAGLRCFGSIIQSGHQRPLEHPRSVPEASPDVEDCRSEVALQDELADIQQDVHQALSDQSGIPISDAERNVQS